MDDGRVDVLGDEHGHVAGGGHEGHEDGVLALGAGHEDGFDLVARFVHGLDDLVGLEGDEFHGGVVVEGEAIDGFVGGETDDGTGHAGVGDGGAVAEEVAVEEEVAAEVSDGRGVLVALHVFEVLVEVVVDVGVVGFGDTQDLLEGWVGFEDVLEELAGGGLSAFCHPVVWYEDITVRAPDSLHKNWLRRHGDVTGRGARYRRQTGECLVTIVAGIVRAEGRSSKVDFRTDSPHPPCVGINDTTADSDAGWKPELVGGLLTQCTAFLTGTQPVTILGSQHPNLSFAQLVWGNSLRH